MVFGLFITSLGWVDRGNNEPVLDCKQANERSNQAERKE